MPPRIRIPRGLPGSFVVQRAATTTTTTAVAPSASVLPFLAPSVLQSSRNRLPQWAPDASRAVSILSSLSDNPTAYNKRIRRGRGPSSGKGKTSGRGHKGQKQHGKVPAGFEGGQTPLWRVKGRRGFVNVHTPQINTVPISRIVSWVAQGRIDASKPITARELALSGCVQGVRDGIKLLASSRKHAGSVDEAATEQLAQPLHIVVSRASRQAIKAVEAAGGTVQTRFYTRFALARIIEGSMDPIYSLQSRLPDGTTRRDKQAEALAAEAEGEGEDGAEADESSPYLYRLPDATSRRDIQYYRDPKHRGYLSYQLKEGDNPSLFFKSAAEYAKYAKKGRGSVAKKSNEGERLW